ncbi:hypothetical protein UFOVP1124_15 [uncultured Caudovirales phage]|uniref:Uncharacterized protein n=1 Tax=uncultured Caudovirales phage TaxID=2100421 RepID=A0A6J5QPJ8_9CAUD|nr:hypothetical protein UFOVP1124_15 [uncultured Caudovirales phage]
MPSSHGFAVTFGGATVGKVYRFRCTLPGGQVVDVTTTGATILGTGGNARVVRQVDITAVDPITLDVEFFGVSGLGPDDRGRRAAVVVSGPISLSGSALLEDIEITGAARDKIRGTAKFIFDGSAS